MDNAITDIEGTLQAQLFDNELSAALDLGKKGHLRAAGTVAGVVLERHLVKVAMDHGLGVRKANPTINDLNDVLKNAAIYDVPQWRRIQHLGDLRNLCAHAKDRDPSKEDVDELIRGVEAITKTVL